MQVGASDSDEEGDTPEEAQRIQAAADSIHAAADSIHAAHPVPYAEASPGQDADIQVPHLYLPLDWNVACLFSLQSRAVASTKAVLV